MKRSLFILPALAVAGVLAAGCLGGLFTLHADVVYPGIVPNTSAPPEKDPAYSFPFGSATVTLSIPVNSSVYAGAKAADKTVTIYGNLSEDVWMPDSYLAMINDHLS